MFMIIIAIIVFFGLLIIIDKNKNKQKKPTPQKKKPVQTLSLDQKIKQEKTEKIQHFTSLVRQIEEQTIEQLTVVLNSMKENKKN